MHIRLENISCDRYQRNEDTFKSSLIDITGDIPNKSFLAIYGGAGSGKSTLLHLLCGKLNHSKSARITGKIRLNGEEVTNLNELMKNAVYLKNEDDGCHLYSFLTVKGNT